MEIRMKYPIERKRICDLDIMRAYIIFDEETHDNQLIVVNYNHEALVLQKHNNADTLCVLKMSADTEVNVVGQVNDFDIVNVDFR